MNRHARRSRPPVRRSIWCFYTPCQSPSRRHRSVRSRGLALGGCAERKHDNELRPRRRTPSWAGRGVRWNDRLARRERFEAEAVRTRLEKAPGKLFGLNAPLLSYEAIAKHSIQRLSHVKNSKLHAVAAPSTVT